MSDATLWPIVTLDDDGIRPAGPADECFYCRAKLGQPHDETCVTVHQKVRVRYSFDVDIDVPHSWTTEDIEFHRNDSSWCAGNAIDELSRMYPENGSACPCHVFTAKVLEFVDRTPTVVKRTPEEVAEADEIRAELSRE